MVAIPCAKLPHTYTAKRKDIDAETNMDHVKNQSADEES